MWDGKTNNQDPAAAGVYFYQLSTNDKKLVRKLLLMGHGQNAPLEIPDQKNFQEAHGASGIQKIAQGQHYTLELTDPDSAPSRHCPSQSTSGRTHH